MDLRRSEIEALASKMIDGSITAREQERLNAWLNQQMGKDIAEVDTDFAINAEQLKDRMLRRILEQTNAVGTYHHRRRMIRWVSYAAAAVLVVAITGTWMFVVDGRGGARIDSLALQDSTDIPPGGSRATLTLADGRAIDLSESQSGILIGDGIRYLDGSSVVSGQVNSPGDPSFTRLLTLSTPKGGTYQITLSDGTHVWLNAASTLTYPEQFTSDERTVEIEGEAYFSVAKDVHRPFKINSRDQEITVLGTEFNISAYADDAEVITTLVEGTVQLLAESSGENTELSPGEQGLMRKGNIRKRSVDPAASVAWKKGIFYFRQTPVEEALKQIERWYDVEVSYKTDIPNETFSGEIGRNVSLRTVLEFLELSGIQAQLIERKLIIE